MHDPSTVCFNIKYPWKRFGGKNEFWPKGYRETFVTIWHEDPLNFEGTCGCRDDDSCGWSSPPMLTEEYEHVKKMAAREYGDIFARQAAIAEKKSYASVCFDLNCHEAIYWIWWRIKHDAGKARRWKSSTITPAEMQLIFNLSSNPVDSLKSVHQDVRDAETFRRFFLCVYRAYQRFNRPWYRHPRWHVQHWRLQIHPWQKLRRRLFDRCAECGKGFGWNESPTGSWSGDKLWHSACSYKQTHVSAFVAQEVTDTVQ